jgi:hypothetical protein
MTGERRRKVRIVLVGGLGLALAGAVVAAIGGGQHERDHAALDGGAALVAPAPPRAAASTGEAATSTPPVANGQSPANRSLPASPGKVDPAAPKIVRTGDLSVRVGKGRFTAAFDRVASVASANGGFVVSSTMLTQGEEVGKEGRRPQAGEIVLRVPADRFDATRQALGELGTVERSSLRGEDVSGQLVDYEARLRSLSAQEDALRTLMAKAGGVAEVLQVQNSLFEVRQQIEQLQAQRDELSQAAALSTLHVSLFEPGAAPVPEPRPAGDLARSLERARDGALAVVGGMVVVLGWLAPLAALALLGWGLSRLRQRRARPSAPAPATS